MPYIDAVIVCKWAVGSDGKNRPIALDDVFAWAIENEEELPIGSFGRREDLTGQDRIRQRIQNNMALFVARLVVTVTTAQHFASDNRFWTLGYWQRDDEGGVITHNWDTPLTAEERTQAANYITLNSFITPAQINAAFDPTDTRREIAEKLKDYFRS